MRTLTDKLARWARAWQRRQLANAVARLARDIDGIRKMREHEQALESQLSAEHAKLARRLQGLAQDEVNRQSRAAVRLLAK